MGVQQRAIRIGTCSNPSTSTVLPVPIRGAWGLVSGTSSSKTVASIPCLERRVQLGDHVIDLDSGGSATHFGVDGIGKIKGGGLVGQFDDIAVWRDGEEGTREETDLGRLRGL